MYSQTVIHILYTQWENRWVENLAGSPQNIFGVFLIWWISYARLVTHTIIARWILSGLIYIARFLATMFVEAFGA